MKKQLFVILLAFAAFLAPPETSQAQTLQIPLISTTNSLQRDTVNTTGVVILMAAVRGRTEYIGIQVSITKISGTLGGTLIPVASNDGVNFYAAGTGTLTVADVTAQGILFSPPNGFAYYGVRWTGTGTMSGSFIAKLVAK